MLDRGIGDFNPAKCPAWVTLLGTALLPDDPQRLLTRTSFFTGQSLE
jgi:hypothetical protein